MLYVHHDHLILPHCCHVARVRCYACLFPFRCSSKLCGVSTFPFLFCHCLLPFLLHLRVAVLFPFPCAYLFPFRCSSKLCGVSTFPFLFCYCLLSFPLLLLFPFPVRYVFFLSLCSIFRCTFAVTVLFPLLVRYALRFFIFVFPSLLPLNWPFLSASSVLLTAVYSSLGNTEHHGTWSMLLCYGCCSWPRGESQSMLFCSIVIVRVRAVLELGFCEISFVSLESLHAMYNILSEPKSDWFWTRTTKLLLARKHSLKCRLHQAHGINKSLMRVVRGR